MQVVSFDGHNVNDGTSYSAALRGVQGLPQVKARWVERLDRWPLVGAVQRRGRRLNLGIAIEESSVDTLRAQLLGWFDPEDETPKALVVEDDDGSNDRYVMAICEAFQQAKDGAGRLYVATLAVHGDVRWRGTSEETDAWNITASGQTKVLANDGTDDAYPRFKIEPTSAAASGFGYKRWVPVRWRLDSTATNYPTDIGDDSFDTATLVTAGKMQADGDDLRVQVDGIEVDRWLDGIDTATTKVWVNLDFQGQQEGTLDEAIAASGSVSVIELNEDISGFPAAGVLMIDSEAFTYTGKTDALRQFTGVTRAAKGTSMAAHSSGATVWWVQHDIWILYGDASLATPMVDDDYEPAFELDHSTNTSWVYEEFGEDDGLRPAAWTLEGVSGLPTFYNGNQNSAADPWVEIGIGAADKDYIGRWRLANLCGITNANFTNGEKYAYDDQWAFEGRIQSSPDGTTWSDEYVIPQPSAIDTWESWSRNEALTSGTKYVALSLETDGTGDLNYLECADVTLTLDSNYTPAITIGAEQTTYSLDCEIENVTTGDKIQVAYEMDIDDEFEVDTDAKTLTDLEDNSNQFQALTLVGGARRDWLPLQPGDNTIKFTDAGTNAVTLTTTWRERYF